MLVYQRVNHILKNDQSMMFPLLRKYKKSPHFDKDARSKQMHLPPANMQRFQFQNIKVD